ncbi:hypothetical protein [Amycolatopsis sp. lyj-108]|uniref:hypothetical protein n=1 Tax=Amycolatopsis sp. lyj-108 TaxID=2789286 RepID=UPI00397E686B
MQIRPVRPTDAAAVNGLLHQLGYPQDDVTVTRWRIQTWTELPTSAAYVAEADGKLLVRSPCTCSRSSSALATQVGRPDHHTVGLARTRRLDIIRKFRDDYPEAEGLN